MKVAKPLYLFLVLIFSQSLHAQKALTLAFGSCSNQELPQVMWPFILDQQPDVWIWMGDIIYLDSENLVYTRNAYQKQKDNPDYQTLRANAEIIGVWDDHDYGLNDGGKNWLVKDQKKELMLEFLDEPQNSQRWYHRGAYTKKTFTAEGLVIDVILLDGRYFRDDLTKSRSLSKRYDPNPIGQGTMLGEEQWYWLEKQLQRSSADLCIIISGTQVLSEEHGFEMWGNMPHEKERLLNLLKAYPTKNVLFLSGDRHIAEVSKTNLEGVPYSVIDVTSSGLTHSYESADEENKYRISPLVSEKNFGVLKIHRTEGSVLVNVELRGLENKLFYEKLLRYPSLK